MRNTLVLTALALGGCDSLVADPCAQSFAFVNGACEALDGGVITTGPIIAGSGGSGSDGSGTDLCTADVEIDPLNCGACGVVCASGVCTDSACAGSIVGHVVAIGHDYTSYDGAMAQVLANAVVLGVHPDVRLAPWVGAASTQTVAGTNAALRVGMTHVGRAWRDVVISNPPTPAQLAGTDVVLIYAQSGDGDVAQATGANWQAALAGFVAGGGVVIVLEGEEGTSYRFAAGAGLFDYGAPTTVTGQLAAVVAPLDATTTNVTSPYMAEATSVAYPTTVGATITTEGGGIVLDYAGPAQ